MSVTVRRLAAALAVSILAGVCAGEARAEPEDLDAAIAEAMTAAKIPGALIGIWSPEGDYVKAFGPVRTDFFSRIGSVTKTFTATAVLQLVDEGKVDLDDPIDAYIDGVPNGENITVGQLASMRSGLPEYSDAEGFQKAVADDPRRDFSPRELLAWAFGLPTDFPPGAQFEYSNTNYILLGMLVEKISALRFGDYLSTRILLPLGLTQTSFPGGTQIPNPHARGYTEADGDGPAVDATEWSPSLTWAAGAMISTLEDMRKWVPAVATGRLRTTLETGSAADFAYGMGIFTVAGWIGHNGSVPGYQTVAVYLPERRTTMVVMINTDIPTPGGGEPGGALARAITKVITPDHVYEI